MARELEIACSILTGVFSGDLADRMLSEKLQGARKGGVDLVDDKRTGWCIIHSI
jgi:hypothetical protein